MKKKKKNYSTEKKSNQLEANRRCKEAEGNIINVHRRHHHYYYHRHNLLRYRLVALCTGLDHSHRSYFVIYSLKERGGGREEKSWIVICGFHVNFSNQTWSYIAAVLARIIWSDTRVGMSRWHLSASSSKMRTYINDKMMTLFRIKFYAQLIIIWAEKNNTIKCKPPNKTQYSFGAPTPQA